MTEDGPLREGERVRTLKNEPARCSKQLEQMLLNLPTAPGETDPASALYRSMDAIGFWVLEEQARMAANALNCMLKPDLLVQCMNRQIALSTAYALWLHETLS